MVCLQFKSHEPKTTKNTLASMQHASSFFLIPRPGSSESKLQYIAITYVTFACMQCVHFVLLPIRICMDTYVTCQVLYSFS